MTGRIARLALCLAVVGALGAPAAVEAQNPVPSLTSLQPSTAVAGAPGFLLTVNGSGFVNGGASVVWWNGQSKTTTFVNSTKLTVQLGTLAGPGPRPVTVVTASPGGGTSNQLVFDVTPTSSNPAPALTSLDPSSSTAGAPGFLLTVNGSGFVGGGASVIWWNGQPKATTFVNSTKLTVQLGTLAGPGPRSVTVVTAAPGGGTSNALTFSVSPVGTGWQGTWTRMADSGFDPRGWVDITFDEANQRTVMFGGSGARYRNDIRVYDAATDTWTLVEPDVSCGTHNLFYELHAPPTPRDEHAVEYDSFNHLYWTFGGSGFACVNANRTAGAGTTTAAIIDPTLSQTAVNFYKDWTVAFGQEGRAYVNAYDPATKRLTLSAPLAGLAAGGTYRLYPQRGGGTYYYSPATGEWQGLNRHWDYTGQTPITRLSPALAYSPLHRALVMFGATGSYAADTWRLNVVTKTWSVLKGSGAPGQPPPLYQVTNSMVYDRANDVFILFGGRCESCSPAIRGETWVYDLNTNTWTNMQPAVSPPARQQHTMVYDSDNGVVIAFGGRSVAGTQLNDTWVYDYPTNTWRPVNTPVAPSPRRLHGLAYDPVNRVSVTAGPVDIWQLELTPP